MPAPGIYITDKHIYQHYPFKKHNEQFWKNVYVKKKDRTDNEHSLDWPEWNRIVTLYKQKVLDYLFTGRQFDVPAKMGDMRVMKVKPRKVRMIDWQTTWKIYGKQQDVPVSEKRFIRQKLELTHGYYLFLQWRKRDIKNNTYFKMRINGAEFQKRKRIKLTDILTFRE